MKRFEEGRLRFPRCRRGKRIVGGDDCIRREAPRSGETWIRNVCLSYRCGWPPTTSTKYSKDAVKYCGRKRGRYAREGSL